MSVALRLAVAAALELLPRPAAVQAPDSVLRVSPDLPRAEQLALLATAAPPVVVRNATLYVQDEHGYVLAREGTNGFSCIIQRGTNGQSAIPRCDDRAGAEALYPTYFLLERMRARGRTVREYRDSLAAGFESKRFRNPVHGSFSYMYSTSAYFVNDDGQRFAFTPHVMINWPGCRPEDVGVGSPAELREVRLSLLGMGTGQCTLIVNTVPETGISLSR